jgi:hypothetical protein
LKKFIEIWTGAHGKINDLSDDEKKGYENLYDFIIRFAPLAWKKYLELKNPEMYEPVFSSLLRKYGKKNPVEMSDGCIFPILSAHRKFIVKKAGGTVPGYAWDIPRQFYGTKFWQKILNIWQSHYQPEEDKIGKKEELYKALEGVIDLELS